MPFLPRLLEMPTNFSSPSRSCATASIVSLPFFNHYANRRILAHSYVHRLVSGDSEVGHVAEILRKRIPEDTDF